MKIIEPSFLIRTQEKSNGIDLLKNIELAGRTAYKSEDKITNDSCIKFIQNIIKREHEAVLEHESLIMKVNIFLWIKIYLKNPKYLNLTFKNFRPIISGNIRALRDFGKKYLFFARILSHLSKTYPVIFDDFDFNKETKVIILNDNDLIDIEEIKEHVSKSVRIICNRGVSHELVRHRVFSFVQESTRYVNYGNKNNGINFIRPNFLKDCPIREYASNSIILDNNILNNTYYWLNTMLNIENEYNKGIANGLKPQEIRGILPNDLKTEIVITSTIKNWIGFFKLRIPNSAHPQMRQISIPLLIEFQKLIPIIFDDIIEINNFSAL
jgi:thymidylate synthase (FAD)